MLLRTMYDKRGRKCTCPLEANVTTKRNGWSVLGLTHPSHFGQIVTSFVTSVSSVHHLRKRRNQPDASTSCVTLVYPSVREESSCCVLSRCTTCLCPLSLAASCAFESQGQPLTRAHRRTSKRPLLAAKKHVRFATAVS